MLLFFSSGVEYALAFGLVLKLGAAFSLFIRMFAGLKWG